MGGEDLRRAVIPTPWRYQAPTSPDQPSGPKLLDQAQYLVPLSFPGLLGLSTSSSFVSMQFKSNLLGYFRAPGSLQRVDRAQLSLQSPPTQHRYK